MPAYDDLVIQHGVQIAVHSEQIKALMEAHRDVMATMNKLMWTTIGGSISITVALLGAIAAIAIS